MQYVFQRGSVYWFQRKCPKQIAALIAKRIISETLGTPERAEAGRRAHALGLGP